MTTTSLIEKAREYVRGGATIEVATPSGMHLGPNPVASMYLDQHTLRYVWAGDDHTHIHDVASIGAGDDGEVLVTPTDPPGMTITIWAVWDQRHLNVLQQFKEAIDSGKLIWWLEGGLDGAANYGGADLSGDARVIPG